MSYIEKIEAIRIVTGLKIHDMSALLGLSSCEYGELIRKTREVKLQEITRIADSPTTRRFIVWLISGRVIPEAGQISPDLSRCGLRKTILQHLDQKTGCMFTSRTRINVKTSIQLVN